MNFNSHTDAAVARAAALVDVATPGERRGAPYDVPAGADLLRALAGALGRPVRPDVAAALVEVGVAAREVFERMDAGDVDGAARAANALLRRYRPTPELDHHDGEPWHLHFHGDPAADPSGWGGGVAVALATVLGGEYADRLGLCNAPRCDAVFVDVSRNGTRRFCSTACQNRVKAAAHRARRA